VLSAGVSATSDDIESEIPGAKKLFVLSSFSFGDNRAVLAFCTLCPGSFIWEGIAVRLFAFHSRVLIVGNICMLVAWHHSCCDTTSK